MQATLQDNVHDELAGRLLDADMVVVAGGGGIQRLAARTALLAAAADGRVALDVTGPGLHEPDWTAAADPQLPGQIRTLTLTDPTLDGITGHILADIVATGPVDTVVLDTATLAPNRWASGFLPVVHQLAGLGYDVVAAITASWPSHGPEQPRAARLLGDGNPDVRGLVVSLTGDQLTLTTTAGLHRDRYGCYPTPLTVPVARDVNGRPLFAGPYLA